MKNLLIWLVKAIVDNPKMVKVSERQENGQSALQLSLSKEDVGKVIGKGGKTIKSLRNLVRVRAIKEGKRVNIELVEA